MFDTNAADAAQEKYCHEKHYPHFAPRSGFCYRCGRDIYRQITWPSGHTTGISVEGAGNHLITGCPHCHYSFCE